MAGLLEYYTRKIKPCESWWCSEAGAALNDLVVVVVVVVVVFPAVLNF